MCWRMITGETTMKLSKDCLLPKAVQAALRNDPDVCENCTHFRVCPAFAVYVEKKKHTLFERISIKTKLNHYNRMVACGMLRVEETAMDAIPCPHDGDCCDGVRTPVPCKVYAGSYNGTEVRVFVCQQVMVLDVPTAEKLMEKV